MDRRTGARLPAALRRRGAVHALGLARLPAAAGAARDRRTAGGRRRARHGAAAGDAGAGLRRRAHRRSRALGGGARRGAGGRHRAGGGARRLGARARRAHRARRAGRLHRGPRRTCAAAARTGPVRPALVRRQRPQRHARRPAHEPRLPGTVHLLRQRRHRARLSHARHRARAGRPRARARRERPDLLPVLGRRAEREDPAPHGAVRGLRAPAQLPAALLGHHTRGGGDAGAAEGDEARRARARELRRRERRRRSPARHRQGPAHRPGGARARVGPC